MKTYSRPNGLTIFGIYTMYEPLRVFMTASAIIELIAAIVWGRFFYFLIFDSGSGHIQSLILGAVLFNAAMVLAALGVIGDLLSGQRITLQRIFERVRRVELELGVPPSHYEPGAAKEQEPTTGPRRRAGPRGRDDPGRMGEARGGESRVSRHEGREPAVRRRRVRAGRGDRGARARARPGAHRRRDGARRVRPPARVGAARAAVARAEHGPRRVPSRPGQHAGSREPLVQAGVRPAAVAAWGGRRSAFPLPVDHAGDPGRVRGAVPRDRARVQGQDRRRRLRRLDGAVLGARRGRRRLRGELLRARLAGGALALRALWRARAAGVLLAVPVRARCGAGGRVGAGRRRTRHRGRPARVADGRAMGAAGA